MDKDGNRVIWTVVIISAIAIIGLMFINFMPSQTSNIKAAIVNEPSSFGNGHTSDSSSSDTAVGTNLYTDTKNFDNLASWNTSGVDPSSCWTKTTHTYKGLAVMQTTQDWNGLSQYIYVKKGDILTYSAYVRNKSGIGKSDIYWPLLGQTEGSYSAATVNPEYTWLTITNSWQRVSATTVATSNGYVRPRIERTPSNTNTLQIAGIKVEKGSVATDWCPNPSEILTQSDYV